MPTVAQRWAVSLHAIALVMMYEELPRRCQISGGRKCRRKLLVETIEQLRWRSAEVVKGRRRRDGAEALVPPSVVVLRGRRQHGVRQRSFKVAGVATMPGLSCRYHSWYCVDGACVALSGGRRRSLASRLRLVSRAAIIHGTAWMALALVRVAS